MNPAPKEDALMESTLLLAEKAFRELFPILPKEWLTLDLTTPQLKVVLLLFVNGATRMSVIASALGVSLATATGVVDRLVDREMVVRESDPDDRRVVLCRLSNKGEQTIVGLWHLAREHAKLLLSAVERSKLPMVRDVLQALLDAGEATRAQLQVNQREIGLPATSGEPSKATGSARARKGKK
jgi:DNA-binding MarR family transcriptional regulator